jgi:hypothetical protein
MMNLVDSDVLPLKAMLSVGLVRGRLHICIWNVGMQKRGHSVIVKIKLP